MKVKFIYTEVPTIPNKITVEYCCYEMYLASAVHHHLAAPGKEREFARLNGIHIKYCPYCGHEIEKIKEENYDTKTVSKCENRSDIQGCGRECSNENTEELQRQRSENNSKCNNVES